MKDEILKRLKSFAWRFGGMALVSLVAFVSNNLDLFNLSPEVIVVIGYVFNEITKMLNTKFDLEGKALGAVRRLAGK